MPIFLLALYIQPVAAANKDVEILFAIENQAQPPKDFKSTFLFGGDDLPHTYSATVPFEKYQQMKASESYLYVEQNSPISVARITSEDPYFTRDDEDTDKQWYLEKIDLARAWDYGTGSKNVTVAIIDTGIHSSHVELDDRRVIYGFDITTNRPIQSYTDSDDNGHGTAVAGLIGAITNNKRGIAGVNWNVNLMPVKALKADGTGSISTVAAGIIWAADNGADIINLSLGGTGFGNDQTLYNAIIHAYKAGAIIVSAAGNDLAEHGNNLDESPVYPVCADGGDNMIIGVAATDEEDKKADFSNYGRNCIDIMAPGKRILTTAYLPSDPSNNVLIYGSGTSLAAPLVSGVAALLKANRPELTNSQIKSIILNTADNIDDLNQTSCMGLSCNGFLGRGRLNALSALEPQPILDGSLIRDNSSQKVYLVSGGKKSLVTDFVLKQRQYPSSVIGTEVGNQLSKYNTVDPLAPPEGILAKSENNPTVYYIHQEEKHALTYLVFQSRKFNFADVKVGSRIDIDSIPEGEWYWPPDGVLVLVQNDSTVYMMEDGVKRPVTYNVFIQRRLSFANVVKVTQQEFTHIPKAPDSYWLAPLDNTLLKSENSDTVYLVVDGAKRPLTPEAFITRKLQYGNIKSIPQSELDVISTGPTLYN